MIAARFDLRGMGFGDGSDLVVLNGHFFFSFPALCHLAYSAWAAIGHSATSKRRAFWGYLGFGRLRLKLELFEIKDCHYDYCPWLAHSFRLLICRNLSFGFHVGTLPFLHLQRHYCLFSN